MIPSLPQYDSDPASRASNLTQSRSVYRFDDTRLPPVAMAAEVPDADSFTLGWKAQVAESIVKLLINSARIHGEEHVTPEHPKNVECSRQIQQRVKDAMQHALDRIQGFVLEGRSSGRASSMEDFRRLFCEIPTPPIVSDYAEDLTFARMRVAGPNPLQLELLTTRDDRLPVSEAQYQTVMGSDDSLERALGEGRLFLADYSMLEGLPCGSFPAGQKYLCAPLGLFAVARGTGARDLHPVAIQLGPRPGARVPLVTPADKWGWYVARAHLRIADAHVHQAVRHLAHTHLVLEPMAVAMHRQLSERHPIAVLLRPHFEGTLAINDAAVTHLLADQGGVDTIMAGRIDAVRACAAKSASEWVFDENMLPRALRRRGVDDPERLPYYPYRDDALLLWQALLEWVEGYLRIYYASAAEVQADAELQAWVRELSAPDGGRLQGIGRSGRIETLESLVETLAHIIFTASAQHAAVNFPQYALMSYAPAQPLAAYMPVPESVAGLDERALLAMMPPLEVAHYQLALGYLLGSVCYTRLGQYSMDGTLHRIESMLFHRGPSDGFTDPRVRAPLGAFQARLAEIEAIIEERNRVRAPYDYLRPSRVPRSTNI